MAGRTMAMKEAVIERMRRVQYTPSLRLIPFDTAGGVLLEREESEAEEDKTGDNEPEVNQ
jgi:hypothetical protein